jgi:DHA2 family multidrug resistance protein
LFLMTTLGFVLYGSLVLLPIMLQTLLGYPSLQAGIAMAPRGWDRSSACRSSGCSSARSIRARWSRRTGVGAFTALSGSAKLNLNAGYWDIFWPQFFQGSGSRALRAADDDQHGSDSARAMGNATSLFNLMRNLGGQHRHRDDRHAARRATAAVHQHPGAHVTPYSRPRRRRSNRRAGLHRVRRGSVTADPARVCAVFGAVQRRPAMVSFVDLFRLLGDLSCCCCRSCC